jgi:LmbE family N-acetylglucosaminyl deacetylase
MTILAHPDDESFPMGGTLAKAAAEGQQVHLVVATRGEAGIPGKSATETAAAPLLHRPFRSDPAGLRYPTFRYGR